MNQEKIGKFIAENRKKMNLTQEELAEKLGVSKNAVSKWERGICLMDMSLLKPLSEILNVSVNEILQGEKIIGKNYEAKMEENLLNTINYGKQQVDHKGKIIGIILIIFGITMTISAMSIFKSDSSWGSVYSILGVIISLIGISRLTKKLSYPRRLIIHFAYFIFFIVILFLIDYISVITLHQVPRFTSGVYYYNNVILYENPIYNVYRVNYDTKNEYFVIDKKKEYTIDTVPKSPFNREKSGIDNLLKYKSKYVGDNSKDGNLINALPFSEFSHGFSIDSKNLGLNINYDVTSWYMKEYYYLERGLVYNAVSLFTLIDNLEYINFHFSDTSFSITREIANETFPNFKIVSNKYNKYFNKDNFNEYLEKPVYDADYAAYLFKKMFTEPKLAKTKKIVVYGEREKILKNEMTFEEYVVKTIQNENDIKKFLEIFARSSVIPHGTMVTSEGSSCKLMLYDKENNLINEMYFFIRGSIGFKGKEYNILPEDVNSLANLLMK